MSDPAALRKPKPQYKGRNGFEEEFPPADGTEFNGAALHAEAQKRRMMEWTLEHKGSSIPSFSEMRKFNEQIETTATVDAQIKALKIQHQKDLDSLAAFFTQLHHQDQRDLQMSIDDCISLDPDDPLYCSTVDKFLKNTRSPAVSQNEWDDAISRLRHSYLKKLIGLATRLEELSSQFPNTIENYRSMSNTKAMQFKVAKYLTASKEGRDKILSNSAWVWRQVKPLVNIYESDDAFKEEVQNFVKERELELQSEVRDPRKRMSSSTYST